MLHHENSSMTFYLEMKVFLVHAVSSINLDIALKPFDDSSLEKVLTGHSNGNSTCSLLNYDFLSGHPKVFLSEAALNRKTDLEWMQAIMLKSSMT